MLRPYDLGEVAGRYARLVDQAKADREDPPAVTRRERTRMEATLEAFTFLCDELTRANGPQWRTEYMDGFADGRRTVEPPSVGEPGAWAWGHQERSPARAGGPPERLAG